MPVLPVSGLAVTLNPLTGAEEMLLLEAASDQGEAALVLALLERVARTTPDRPDWAGLAITDADALLLSLRQAVFGDRMQAESACPDPECGARIDLSLSVAAYLAHHAVTWPRGVETEEESGWFRLRDTAITFRRPTLGDQIAAARQADPAAALQERCLRPFPLPARRRQQVERALEALAPSLNGALQALCPECGASLLLPFSPRAFTLRELREQAAFLYADIHLLAREYHWPEAAILSLPRRRRLHYAEAIRQGYLTA